MQDKRIFTQDIEKKGLKTYVGSEYNIRVASAKDSQDKIDFTKVESKAVMMFPTSNSMKKDIEVIESKRLGIATSLKYLGKTQITGDQGDVATPNGIAWYNDMVLGGVVKSVENDKAIISIEAEGEFLLSVIGATTVVIENTTSKDEITITDNMTVKQFIDAVNKIKDNEKQKYLAVLHVGDGSETLSFSEDSYNCNIRHFFEAGSLSDETKKTVAPYITYIIPRRGDPRYFNILESSNRAPMSTQFWGCRFLSLSTQFQNSNLTNLTANIWGGYAGDFDGTPTQAEIDDLNNVYSQTNYMTATYCSRQRATTLASMTNTFTWTVEPSWNISNEPYEIPVSAYADSFDFEMMFNEQSKALFQDKVNNGENISIMIDTTCMKDGKEYKYIKSAKSLLGQPQYPQIADGVIQLSASGFTAVASPNDPYTSLVIITSDKKFDITYTKDQIQKDFSGYTK